MLSQLFHNLTNLKESVTSLDDFQDDVLIAELDLSLMQASVESLIFPAPSRYDALIFVGIEEGSIELSIDYITYKVSKHGIIWILPTHITQILQMYPDFKGWILIISKSFLEANPYLVRNNTPLIHYMQLKKKPFSTYDPEEFQSIYNNLLTLSRKMRQETHLFHRDIINNSIVSFFLDMANYFLRKKDNIIPQPLSRKDELFLKFLELLNKHCKEQHEVSFYADKLCITPQYLSLALKEESGKSAIQWIHNALIVESKGLLKAPGLSIQEVANKLNFVDQSTFGKFFKKQTGLSPLTFRKS